MRPARAWVFTHHWKDGRTPRLLDFEACESIDYAVYQTEICPTTGKHHFQGYVHSVKSIRPTALYPCGLNKRTHFEPARRGPVANITYCTKSDTRIDGPWEYGTPPLGGQGTRSDISGLVDAVKSGKSDLELLESHAGEYVKYYRAIDRIRLLLLPNRSSFEGIYLFLGEPGTGKSYCAHCRS